MKQMVFAIAIVFAFGSAAWAGPDKISEACVDISSINGGSQGFTNGVSSAKIKMGKCKILILLKDVALNPGEQVICIAGADVKSLLLPPTGSGNSIVLRGVEKSGKVKMIGKLDAVGCGLPGTKAATWNGEVRCYREDLLYSDSNDNPANWQASCAGTVPPMLAIPNAGAGAGSDPAKINLLGLCQGMTSVGERILPPASAEICRQGLTNLEL